MGNIKRQAAPNRKRGHQDHLATAPPRRAQCAAIATPGTGAPVASIPVPDPVAIHIPRGEFRPVRPPARSCMFVLRASLGPGGP
eukprot:4399230-Pyramimonas_sp.AAC.1